MGRLRCCHSIRFATVEGVPVVQRGKRGAFARLAVLLSSVMVSWAGPTFARVNFSVSTSPPAAGKVSVSVVLHSGPHSVGATQSDLLFDTSIVTLPSAAACKINPALGTDEPGCLAPPVVGPCKTLSRNFVMCGSTPPSPGCEEEPVGIGRFRGIVAPIVVRSASEIPDGSVLFTCEFTLVNPSGLPTEIRHASAFATDPQGTGIEAAGTDGTIWAAGDAPVEVNVGTAAPDVAGKALVSVTLAGAGAGVVQNDILFDSTKVDLSRATQCRLNPAVGTGRPGCERDPPAGPCKTMSQDLASCDTLPVPPGCEGQPPQMKRLRASIAATTVPNLNEISSGTVMYTCEFDVVARDRLPADLTIGNVVVSDPSGRALRSAGASGVIRDLLTPTLTPTATQTRSPVPTRTPTATRAVEINLRSNTYDSSTKATVDAILVGSGVGGTQNDLVFDHDIIRLASAARCRLNPSLADSAPACAETPPSGPCLTASRQLISCGARPSAPGCVGQPASYDRLRIVLAATEAAAPIPNGSVLYSCEFDVVAPGRLAAVVRNDNQVASTPSGERLDATGSSVLILRAPTPTATATRTPTPTSTASATPTPQAGDCDRDGRVAVDDIFRGVSIALGTLRLDRCPSMDRNGDGIVTINEVLQAVTLALG